MPTTTILRRAAVLFLLLPGLALPGLGACSRGAVQKHPEDLRRLIRDGRPEPEVRFAPIDPAERMTLLGEAPDRAYRLGIGDILHVQGDLPFLEGFGETTKGEVAGTHVKPDGRIYLPQVGGVPAAGRSVIELQDDLRQRLEKFRESPYVSVDVLEYRSQQFYVLGDVNAPGAYPVNGRTTLVGAVAGTGGLAPTASLDTAYVLRRGKVLPLNLADVLVRGDMSRDTVMQHGDIVYVPSYEEARVFVVGQVNEPGPVPMPKGQLTLAGAIGAARGLDFATADYNDIRVFRGTWANPSCYTISACELYAYGEGIGLRDGDRIIVAPTQQATYKRTLDLTMPYVLSLTSTALAAAGIAVAASR
jgi:polysaccharide export outer membrane protein